MVEKRNKASRRRDELKGADREVAHAELKEAQKLVQERLVKVRERRTCLRNKTITDSESKDPRVYWNLLKRTVGLNRKKVEIPDEVLFDGVVACGDRILEVWREAFKRLGAVDGDEKAFKAEFLEEIQQEVSREMAISHLFDSLNIDLNKPISEDEVVDIIAELKQGKAAGVDAMINEIFRYGGPGIGKATARLCEEMFRVERVPTDWARGLIFPLFKDGDARVPDNYRGITLLSVVGKIYTSILNARVTLWCEKHGVLSEEQAGFRPGRSTVDHIFTLSEVLRLRRARKKQTYCAFLDIRKAYDTVHRDGLWKRLIEVGIRGKMWRVLKNLYDIVESCVLVGKRRTEWFTVEAGVRQGCILSPILFAIFIDGLARAVKQVKVRSILEGIQFNIILFADDIVLMAESEQELQKLLNAVFEYSERWRFKWNGSKSKVMHFGPHKSNAQDQFLLGSHVLEMVKSFKYLGVDLQENLSWAGTKKRFALKAKSRSPMVLKAMLEGLSVSTGIKLWETMVRPTLEYATEIWGVGNWPEAEVIQQRVGKMLLGVSKMTAKEVVRGELGWMSLSARREIKVLKYWGRILNMDDSRLVKQVYRRCKQTNSRLKGSFCEAVRKTLEKLKLEHLWASEQIGKFKDWVIFINACVKRSETDLWQHKLSESRKLRTYRLLKTELRQEEYLSWQLPTHQRSQYARLRSGTHQLRVETGRWKEEKEEERICRICVTGKIDTEEHFLLDCYVFERLRQKLFLKIKENTGYDCSIMRENSEWLMDTLLGHGLEKKETRRLIGEAVSKFIATAMRVRKKFIRAVESELKQSKQG